MALTQRQAHSELRRSTMRPEPTADVSLSIGISPRKLTYEGGGYRNIASAVAFCVSLMRLCFCEHETFDSGGGI